MRRLLLSLFILLSSLTGISAETDIHERIRTAVAAGDRTAAITALTQLETSEAAAFEKNNYPYLTARLYEADGRLPEAMAAYQKVAAGHSPLREYALWHLADIARQSGNFGLERIFLAELASFYPQSLLTAAARERTARSYYESSDFPAAARLFTVLLSAPSAVDRSNRQRVVDPFERENRLLLARSMLAAGDAAGAQENFAILADRLANPAQPDDLALEAVKGLDAMGVTPEDIGKSVPPLGVQEHLRRAQIYHFNREFAGARLHFLAIVNQHSDTDAAADAVFQIGRGYSQTGEIPEAIRWFERVLEQYPSHPLAADALLQAAGAYSRVGKYKESITRYEQFIAKYPDDLRLDRAYLNIVDVLRDQEQHTEAIKQAERIKEIFRGKPAAAVAQFAIVRVRIARNEWEKAIAGIDELLQLPDLGTNAPGGTNVEELRFVRAFALENAGRFAEAVETYLSIPDGRASYYGGRATERLAALAQNENAKNAVVEASARIKAVGERAAEIETRRRSLQSLLRLAVAENERKRLIAELRSVYEQLPPYKKVPAFRLLPVGRRTPVASSPRTDASHQNIADELIFLGLFDEAAPELEAASDASRTGTSPANDRDFTLAVIYARGNGMAWKAAAFAEPLWRSVPDDFQVDLMPRDQLQLLYPAPFKERLLASAVPRRVDPRFLLSIIRQESRYRPDVKSFAAARGLMQFISTTSERIARELGRGTPRQTELYDPSTAILFGSQYVADLFLLFPNQPAAVAASYNGGEENMQRWIKRSAGTDADRYVPEIAFAQSKDYVYKVMANYRIYKMAYHENLSEK